LREGVQAERRRRQLPLFWHRFLAPCFTAAPRFWVPTAKPVWDPATWQLIAILDAAWNADGVSFVGRERGQLFHVLGTRRMARTFGWPRRRTLAGCRTAYRVWRHWFQTQEVRRLVEIDTWPLPEPVRRVIGGPRPLYRQARDAHRTGRPAENLAVLPAALRRAFDATAAASAASVQSPRALRCTPPPARQAGPAVSGSLEALVWTVLGWFGLSSTACGFWAALNTAALEADPDNVLHTAEQSLAEQINVTTPAAETAVWIDRFGARGLR